jgi:hypothetical protein
MGILLRPDDRVEEDGVGKRSPLAGYAAEHWVTHAQFERVSSFVRKAMEYLFDPDKPYFAAWLQLHDIDTGRKEPFVNSQSLGHPALFPYTTRRCVDSRSCRRPGGQVSTACEHQRWRVWDAAGRSIGGKAFSDSKASSSQRCACRCPRQSWDHTTLFCILVWRSRDGSAITRLQSRCQYPQSRNNTPIHRLPLGSQSLDVHQP